MTCLPSRRGHCSHIPLPPAAVNQPVQLFVDGQTLLSQEGTTQGDPFAMPFYALATIPLIHHLYVAENLKQVWYADDVSATGSITSLRSWWDALAFV